ncbi:alcohol dehydrogenase catalytic domain-containing protein [bacterium]|nr:alcohol dehydrogenase catalytic domain-containing protein [bacterium]
MKAAAYSQLGGLEVLKIMDLPTPEPGPGQVRLKVAACSLNHIDIWVRAGRPMDIPMPHVGGCDVVGVIDALGTGVTGFVEGQRVLVAPGQGCGRCEQCLAGWDNRCESFRVMGLHYQGGFAEYTLADARFLHPVGDVWSPAEWACFPLAALTAWNMVITRCCARRRHSSRPAAAASAPSASSWRNSPAPASGRPPDQKRNLRKPGRWARTLSLIIETRTSSSAFLSETGGRGVDVVFEHVGRETWPGSLACLRRGGRMVHCGVTTGNEIQIDIRPPTRARSPSTAAIWEPTRRPCTVLELAARKKLLPALDRSFLQETRRSAAVHAGPQTFRQNRDRSVGRVVAPASCRLARWASRPRDSQLRW